MYSLYLLSCRDKSLYCGIASDLAKRLAQHNAPNSRTKYTRSRRPVGLVYSKKYRTLSAALKAEAAMKKLSRAEKLRIVSTAGRPAPAKRARAGAKISGDHTKRNKPPQ